MHCDVYTHTQPVKKIIFQRNVICIFHGGQFYIFILFGINVSDSLEFHFDSEVTDGIYGENE